MHGVAQSAWGQLPLPLDSAPPDHMQCRDIPHPRFVRPCGYIVVCQNISVFPSHVNIETSCGYTSSLTRENPLRVCMDLMQGFCVEIENQVSGLFGAVTEVLLRFCDFGCIPCMH